MKVALILLAIVAVAAADSYGKSSYGHGGYKQSYGHDSYGKSSYGHGGYKQSYGHGHDSYSKPSYGHGGYDMAHYSGSSSYGRPVSAYVDVAYDGYDYKPAGHQKITSLVQSHPVQVQSYGGYNSGYGKQSSYSHGGYDNKGYSKSSY